MKNINLKKNFLIWNGKKVKNGSFSIAMTAIVIAIIVVINMVAGRIPSSYTKIDMSSNQLYTIGDQSKSVAEGLTEDVTLYLMAENGSEDSTLLEMLERYEDLSGHITVETKDPVLYPNFASQYTEEEVSSNSIIVVSGQRSKVVDYNNLYETSINYSNYSYEDTGFDGEGQITSAIAYVTSEDLPILYVLQGHGEMELTDSMTAAIEKENIEIGELNLITAERVPEDASCLWIGAPTSDFSKEEAEKIITYLEEGGSAFLVSDYTTEDMTNFQSVLDNYGVETKEGIVLEGDANHYISGNPAYLVPDISSGEAAGGLGSENIYVLMPLAQAIQMADQYRDTISMENLLTTSDSAYVKEDVENMETLSKESGDEEGSFTLGAAITETYDDTETKMVYLTSSAFFNDQIDQVVSGGNLKLMTNLLTWLCDQDSSISIPSKSLQISYLTLTAASAGMWSTISMAVLPIFSLLIGGVIWFKRRKQ